MSTTLVMTQTESRLRLMAEVRSNMRRPSFEPTQPAQTPSDTPERIELIQTLRAQIEQGVYDTDDKLDAALDAMLDTLLDGE